MSWIVATAAFVIGLVAGLGTWWAFPFTRKGIVNPVTRLTMNLQDGLSGDLRIQLGRPFIPLALSPDGARIAWCARGVQGQQLFVRELSEFQARAIPGTAGATTPFFSPDGRWVGFWANGMLRKISVRAVPQSISAEHRCRLSPSGGPATRSSTTQQLPVSLWAISANGGEPKEIRVRTPAAMERIALHSELPGGDLLISCVGASASYLEVLSRNTGERRRLMRGGTSYVARYLPTPATSCMGMGTPCLPLPWIRNASTLVGAPVPVMQGIHNYFGAFSSVALSDVWHRRLPARRPRSRGRVCLGGPRRERRANTRGTWQYLLALPAVPRWTRSWRHAWSGAQSSVWIFDLERGRGGCSQRPTATGRSGAEMDLPHLRSPDAREPEGCFANVRMGLETKSVSSSGALSRIRATGLRTTSRYCSKKVRRVGVSTYGSTPAVRLRSSSRGPLTSGIRRSLRTGAFSHISRVSPTTRTSMSNPFRGRVRGLLSQARVVAPTPRWGPSGPDLYYLSGTKMMVVSVEREPVLRAGRPRAIFESTVGDAVRDLAGWQAVPDGDTTHDGSPARGTSYPELG